MSGMALTTSVLGFGRGSARPAASAQCHLLSFYGGGVGLSGVVFFRSDF